MSLRTLFCLLEIAFIAASSPLAAAQNVVQTDGKYVIIGWNDLGMHCISPRFSEICILPPYNTFRAIVIRRGDEPDIVTGGVQVTYSLDNNKTVAGKTDFWKFAPLKLFGTQLKSGTGLAGFGLSGKMRVVGGVFQAEGVPALPYDDNKVWNPYQRATLVLSGVNMKATAKTSIVVPVSDEMNCQKCHAAGQVAALSINTGTVEGNILTLHDQKEHTDLMNHRPVLCASCHADPALKAAGKKGVSSLSLAMHWKHSTVAAMPACYDCHPGQNTHCNRSAARNMGPNRDDPRCVVCHGDLIKMAGLLRAGRTPWVQEPTCAQCHGPKYSTGNVLYRNARGHGGVLCVACHNSPHAWWPSTRKDDNLQPLTLQKNAHAIGHNGCSVCHTGGRKGSIPPHQID